MMLNIMVRKKLQIRTASDESTTASVVARPTPTAPSRVVKPFWQLMNTIRSEEHTSELQSHSDLVCRLLLEKKKLDRVLHVERAAGGKPRVHGLGPSDAEASATEGELGQCRGATNGTRCRGVGEVESGRQR